MHDVAIVVGGLMAIVGAVVKNDTLVTGGLSLLGVGAVVKRAA